MSYLTQEDLNNFGHEIIDLIQRGSRQTMAPILDRLEERDEQLREGLQRATKTAIDHALDTAVPNWRQVNSDPRWIGWLNFPEPLSGCRRQDLLNDAVARGDADRVARIFRGFIAEAGGQPAPSSRPASVLPASYPAPSSRGRIYSREDITRMAALHRRKAISDEEYAKWEHEFIRAANEGRVRGALDPATGCQP